MRHHITDNELLRFSTNNNAEVKDLFLSPFIGCGVATPRQFLFSSQKSGTTMQQNSQEEIWKDIPGHEGLYQVSNTGKVKSFHMNKDGRIMSPVNNGKGYLNIILCNERKNREYVHRLVALVFCENPNKYIEVNHIDGNKSNNNFENLEWCSRRQNVMHSYRTGLSKGRNVSGKLNPRYKNGQSMHINLPRICEYCKKSYTATFNKRRFCSISCSSKNKQSQLKNQRQYELLAHPRKQ